MNCEKLKFYCHKYKFNGVNNNTECEKIYLKCIKQISLRKRKSLPIPLKVGVKGESSVFTPNTR